MPNRLALPAGEPGGHARQLEVRLLAEGAVQARPEGVVVAQRLRPAATAQPSASDDAPTAAEPGSGPP